MAQAPVAEPPGSIYRLRVVLAGISPMIWRQGPALPNVSPAPK
jgi:hypothetical protein